MARVNVRHEFDQGAFYFLMRDPTGVVAQDMYRRGQQVRSRAIQLAGVDTGRLRASISVDLVPREGTLAARVGTPVDYAGYHHEGHGAIRPVRAKVLAFRVGGGGCSRSRCAPLRAPSSSRRPCRRRASSPGRYETPDESIVQGSLPGSTTCRSRGDAQTIG